MPDDSQVSFVEHLTRVDSGWYKVEYTSIAIRPKLEFSVNVTCRRPMKFDDAATPARVEFRKWIAAGCPPQAKPDQGEG
jgi:hypothetical protein